MILHAYQENDQIVIEIPIAQFNSIELFQKWAQNPELDIFSVQDIPDSQKFAQHVIDQMNEPTQDYTQQTNPGEVVMMYLFQDMKKKSSKP